MVSDELSQLLRILAGLLDLRARHSVPRHRDGESNACRLHSREHAPQISSGSSCLGGSAALTVIKRVQPLAHGIAIRDSTVIHEGDVPHTPAQQSPRYRTS